VNLAPTPHELLPYLDEPPQHPVGGFGKVPMLRLRFERRGERSILASMERRAPLLVLKTLYCDEGMPELPVVYVISNSGGILQGDRYTMDFAVAADAFAHVTSQSATKIHEMDVNHASQIQTITLEDGAYLEYLPEPVIPFARSRFLMRTDVEIAPSATLLYGEILMAGRKYYGEGELFKFDVYSCAVHAKRPDGSPLFVEKYLIEPARSAVARAGVMGDYHVYGNVLLLTPPAVADAVAARAVTGWNRGEGWAAGVSRLPNSAGLIYKILARESEPVRQMVRDFWTVVRAEAVGRPVHRKFPWR